MSTSWLTFCVRTWSLLAQAAPPAPGGPAAPAPPPVPSQVVQATAEATGVVPSVSVVQGIALFLHMCICLGLILCVMYRNTKSEGLGSVFSGGGGSSAAFRGKQSSDEMLGMWTGRLAVAFIASSFLLWIFFYRG